MCKVIGIDISKASFDVSYEKSDGEFVHFKLTNNIKGFHKLLKVIEKTDHCIMEATGPYYLSLAQYLFEKGIKVSVVNPLQVKHFVRMRMVKAKTDKKDAKMIALYGQSEHPDLWEPDEQPIMQIHQLNAAIEGLKKQTTMLKNRMEAFSQIPDNDTNVMKELRSLLRVMESKTAKLEKRLLEITKQHYEQTFRLVTDIPAIGPKTAIMLIAITNNFQKFNDAKKLSSYVGLSPRIYQSGTSVHGKGHITKMGNSQMRKLLYLCSWSAKRCNSQCKAMYERMSEKGKPERVIKTAIANKLLRQAFAIGKSLSDYQENYQKTFVF